MSHRTDTTLERSSQGQKYAEERAKMVPNPSDGHDVRSKSKDYRGSEYSQESFDHGQDAFQPSSSFRDDSQANNVQQATIPQRGSRKHQSSHNERNDRTASSYAATTNFDPTSQSGSFAHRAANSSRASSSYNQHAASTPTTSPSMAPYYSSSAAPPQQHYQGFPASYSQSQLQHHPATYDLSSSNHQLMTATMGTGNASAGGGMPTMEGHMMGSTNEHLIPSFNANRPSESIMDSALYYPQHYSSTYGPAYKTQQQQQEHQNHQAYYQYPTPSANQMAEYSNMMTAMQGYSSPMQYSTPAYNMHQTQYAMSPYTAHHHHHQPTPSTNPAYYSNSQRPTAWSLQHWHTENANGSQSYHQQYQNHLSQPMSTMTSSYSRRGGGSHRMSSGRPGGDGLANSTSLPLRPMSFRTSSFNDRSKEKKEPIVSSEKGNQIPGKGLRPHYHPQQGPRSEFVMWCGNVPSDTNVEELWAFFSCLPPATGADEHETQHRSKTSKTEKVAGKNSQKEEEGLEEDGEPEQDSDPAMSPRTGHGVLSIFIIARSNCAFVNYATCQHLQRAVQYFHGQTLRPLDSRCPRLVCRVRKKDDEAQAGVAGQRGRGIHVAWVKEQDRRMRKQNSKSRSEKGEEEEKATLERVLPKQWDSSSGPASTTLPSPAENSNTTAETTATSPSSATPSRTPSDRASLHPMLSGLSSIDPILGMSDPSQLQSSKSIASQEDSSGSLSYTSTNSSLFRHPAFHERFFILKSLDTDDLDRSIQTGLWATQPHNEQVLDQAFRNSETVFLIFSANQSGGFYGFAKMAGPILSSREVQSKTEKNPSRLLATSSIVDGKSSSSSGSSSSERKIHNPGVIQEQEEKEKEGGEEEKELTRTPPDVGHIDLSRNSLHPMDTSSSLFPPKEDGPSVPATTSSPQQLTPAVEVMSPLSDTELQGDADLAWPVYKGKELSEVSSVSDQSRKKQTSSPNTTLASSDPLASSESASCLATSGYGKTGQVHSHIAVVPSSEQVGMDEFGVRRKDMASFLTTSYNSDGGVRNGTLNQAGSLGPTDSASYPDARLQHHLALRALIHNLRIEERESILQAEQLESRMKVGHISSSGAVRSDSAASGHTTTTTGTLGSIATRVPKTESSDSWGKPFKVEWIKTTSLSFNQVRKLRNPWRDNRQVKVSRDGTELEPNVGRLLLLEWEKMSAPTHTLAGVDDEEEEDEEK
ncbi:hypothetical protein CBS101457_006239 [Exobasidium rhododendri]|nr:hypothetical protein CBS101457_006239 [Exobasidium rhododendri]